VSAGPLFELDRWLAGYRTFWAARLVDLKRVVEAVQAADLNPEPPESP
jgi:hypothetical protein